MLIFISGIVKFLLGGLQKTTFKGANPDGSSIGVFTFR